MEVIRKNQEIPNWTEQYNQFQIIKEDLKTKLELESKRIILHNRKLELDMIKEPDKKEDSNRRRLTHAMTMDQKKQPKYGNKLTMTAKKIVAINKVSKLAKSLSTVAAKKPARDSSLMNMFSTKDKDTKLSVIGSEDEGSSSGRSYSAESFPQLN